jgi:hypothetical protein
MRQGPHNKRGRGRGGNNNRRSGTPNRNQTFDSNGPDVRIRGNANQVHEKYLNLARDAAQNGDRVLAESYFQHAEHYFRSISAFSEETGGDANRNRGNGAQQNHGEEQQLNQFQEGEPQPELNLSTANAPSGQPASTGEQSTSRPDAASEATGDDAAGAKPAEASPAEASPTEAAPSNDGDDARPARRPLSLRRRRPSNGDDAPAQRDEDRSAPSEQVTPGVTVTVVGAPTVETNETAPAPRPRRRPRAAPAPSQPEEIAGD